MAEPISISALQHLLYCERQCALIHVEQAWAENRFTAEGRVLHERSDAGGAESRGDLRILRGVALRCRRLGLVGKADVVEMHQVDDSGSGTRLHGVEGHWRPVPVEYKRGRPKKMRGDEVQLCAQALCLEEMMGVPVPMGTLYYGKTRRRQRIEIGPDLRSATEVAIRRVWEILERQEMPPPVADERCPPCSLVDVCLPYASKRSAREYLATEMEAELLAGG